MSHWSRNQWYIILAVTRDHWWGVYTSTGTITTHYQTIWHSPSGLCKETQGKCGGLWLICTVGNGGHMEEDENEEWDEKKESSAGTWGSVSNATSLIRDATRMQQGWVRGNEGSCSVHHFVQRQASHQAGFSTSLSGNWTSCTIIVDSVFVFPSSLVLRCDWTLWLTEKEKCRTWKLTRVTADDERFDLAYYNISLHRCDNSIDFLITV